MFQRRDNMDNKIYEDELLEDLFFAASRLDQSNPFLISLDEKIFFFKDDIVILVPCDPNVKSFQIINIKKKNGINDPFEEVFVDQDNLSVQFYGKTYKSKRKLLISANYDNNDKIWDVKSYINGERPSTLYDSLDELLSVENGGVSQRDGFLAIISLCYKISKNNDNQISNGKVLKK